MTDVFCNRCGHRNPSNSNFCSSCGSPLPARAEDHTITLAPDEVGDPTEEVSVAREEILLQAEAQFDPDVVAAFEDTEDELREIRRELAAAA